MIVFRVSINIQGYIWHAEKVTNGCTGPGRKQGCSEPKNKQRAK